MIFGLWGSDKSCKTTLALTFPKPLAYQELDIGGFRRATANDTRYGFMKAIQDGSIITKHGGSELKYIMPYQVGEVDLIKRTVRPSKVVVGIKELWYKWLIHYITLLEDKAIATIVVDTATLLWEVCSTGYLQEKQEVQLDGRGNVSAGERLRTSLLPIEYREPNIRMRGVIYQAKAHEKNLVLTHHARDEYAAMMVKGDLVESKTGKKERSGWAPLGDGADIIVHATWNEKKRLPTCIVELAEVKAMEGLEIEEPTYEKIQSMLDMLRG